MKRSIISAVLASLFAVISILVAAPAPAQEETTPEASGSGAAIAASPGEAPPTFPYFAYNGDGTVTIDGDTGTSCFDFALTERGIARTPDREHLAESVLRQCEQDGLLSPDNRYAAYPPSQGRQAPGIQAGLPATGGMSLPVPGVMLAGGALLVSLTAPGIVARRRAS